MCGELKAVIAVGAGKPSLKRAMKWRILDTKPGELTMVRMKLR